MIVQAPVARLLRLIIEKQSTAFLLTQGIQEDDFAHKDAKAAFSWLKSFNDRWGKFPDVETVEQEIGLKLPKIVEDEDFTLVSFKKYAQSKKIERLMTDASLRLEAKDVEGAASILGQIANLKLATAAGHSFRGTAYERYDRYESGKASIGSGLSTPWPRLTEQVIGYLPSTLTTLIAMSNVGKTWLSVIHACYFLSLGKRVALVSLEDSLELVENRLDSYYYKINNKDLNKHRLKLRDDIKWADGLLGNIEGEGDIYTYTREHVKTVADLASVVDSCQADVLIVDAAYCLQATGIESGWKTSEAVVNQLQDLMSTKNIPIIVTVQQDPNEVKKKTKHERLYSTRGGKFWGIGSSLVLELTADEDQRLRGEARLTVCKNKNFVHSENNETGEIDLNWNLLKMDFSELNPEAILEDLEW